MKKAQGLSLDFVIIAAIGLLVLIIIGYIFVSHSTRYSKDYTDVSNKAVESAQGNQCKAFFTGANRKCSADKPAEGEWEAADGEWEDCLTGEQCYREIKRV